MWVLALDNGILEFRVLHNIKKAFIYFLGPPKLLHRRKSLLRVLDKASGPALLNQKKKNTQECVSEVNLPKPPFSIAAKLRVTRILTLYNLCLVLSPNRNVLVSHHRPITAAEIR